MADASFSFSFSSPSSPSDVQQKIRCAFDNLELGEFGGFFQFWAPIKTTAGRWLLTTSDQPFLITQNHDAANKYRLCSVRYQYNIDMNHLQALADARGPQCAQILDPPLQVEVEDEEDPSIINGAPARAFLNRMPELVPDLRVHRMTPLESSALQCGLFHSVMLPVFYPSQSCCVGVVECSSNLCFGIINMVDLVTTALQEEGLKMFNARQYETICGLQHAKGQISAALGIMWPKFFLDLPKFHLDIVQVWIAYKDEDHVPFSSSMEDTQTKRMLGLKLTDGYSDDYEHVDAHCANDCFVDYINICNEIPLKMGEGLIGQTLEDHKPRFMKRVSELSDNQPLTIMRHYYGDPFECSCFVICLRSTETGDLVYAFEFLWREVSNYAILLESLLLLLKKCLPNFKYAFGGEIGDELHITDVEKSTKSKYRSFTIFKGNNSSSASEALEKRSRVVKECLTPLKRKRKDQSDTNEEDNGAFQDLVANNREMYLDKSTLTIKAEYEDDMIKFHLPISSATFANIVKEIGEGLKLNPANYKLKYLDEDGDWILMNSDKDVRVCIKDLRNSTRTVRLRLLPGQNI